MNSRRMMPFALIASALAVAVGWHVTRGPAALSPGPAPLQPDSSSAEGVPALARGARASEARAEVHPEAVETGPMAASQESVLRGRVVSDELNSALPGASVTITYRLHGEFRNPDPAHSEASRAVGELLTDGEGRFEASVPRATPLDVEVSAPGHATARRGHLFAGEDIELRLTPAAILEGVLTRASDGAPVADALVRGRDGARVEQCRARTDPGGAFFFDDLSDGVLTVEITPRDAKNPPWKKVELRAGTRTRLDLVLDAGVRIHGVVSDPQGRPIAGAEVGEGDSFRKSAFSDALGRYELVGFGGTRFRDLRARASGYGSERHAYEQEEMPTEDMRLDFVLQPARSATGWVVDSGGGLLEGVYVAGIGEMKAEGVSRSDWESSVTGVDGRFELTSLHTALGHQLLLRKEGFGTRVYDFPADEGERDRVDLGEFVLFPGARVEGSLRTQTGDPIPGHTVKLRGTNEDLDRLRPETDATNATWQTSVRESRTDTRGRFHFADVPGGAFKVTASVRGRPSQNTSASVQVPESGLVAGIELILDIGAPITGVVRGPDGSPVIGAFVHVATGEKPRIRTESRGGGKFELLGVSAEMGEVVLYTTLASHNWNNPDARLGAATPVSARAGDANVTLVLRELVLLSGRVEDAAGQPVAGVTVSAFASGSSRLSEARLAKTVTDEAGAFHMDLPEDSRVDLETEELQVDAATEALTQLPAGKAQLAFIASDAREVVLCFAE